MLVTVFTPSFNRAHTIRRVYDSLLGQTVKDFEWIIVDDGSSDGTEELVQSWITEGILPILYVRQRNKGKFRTLIETIDRANGEWFLIADSDDEFVPETIATFLSAYNDVPDEKKDCISGVTGLVMDSETREVIGRQFPIPEEERYLLASVNDIIYRSGITGEKWGILKTSVLKEFSAIIPVPEDVKYIGEQALWATISEKYLTVFINVPLRIYYQGTSDTLSSRNITGRYPLGAWITERTVLPCIWRYLWYQPRMIFFSLVKLNYASFLAGKSFLQTVNGFPTGLKMLMMLARPAGYVAKLKYPKK